MLIKYSSFFLLCTLIAIIAVASLVTNNGAKDEESASLSVVSATIFPIYDMLGRVGEGVVEPHLLLPAGASPHTFEITPETVKQLERSKLVFVIGNGLDDWTLNSILDARVIVRLDKDITLRESEEDGGNDPHYWLDGKNAMVMAGAIAQELKNLRPESADLIQKNLQNYLIELEAMDARVRDTLVPVLKKKMITFHDAWYYFAQAYDLEIVGTFEPAAGREPTPRYLAQLSQTIKQAGVKVLYAEPEFSEQSLKAFLEDHDAKIAVLDPLGGTPPNDSYIKMMIYNAFTIAQNQ